MASKPSESIKKGKDNGYSENITTQVKTGVSAKKNNANVGLRVPGSNWKMYKNIATKTSLNNQPSSGTRAKKKKNSLISNTEPNKLNFQCHENKNQISKCCKEENKQVTVEQVKLTRCIAMDCEMVGIGDGKESMIARVSIVNDCGVCIYDKYVKPMVTVKNYRTPVSGIRPHHLKNGEDFEIVHKEVADILRGRILVGHALHNDLYVLFLFHPKHLQRDTAKYFRKLTKGSTPSLKRLATEFLDLDIQNGEHNSIEDARTAMQLYKLFKTRWENDLRRK